MLGPVRRIRLEESPPSMVSLGIKSEAIPGMTQGCLNPSSSRTDRSLSTNSGRQEGANKIIVTAKKMDSVRISVYDQYSEVTQNFKIKLV